jgi:hypothetical protein
LLGFQSEWLRRLERLNMVFVWFCDSKDKTIGQNKNKSRKVAYSYLNMFMLCV